MAEIVFTFNKETGQMTFETTVAGQRCQGIHESITRGMGDLGAVTVESHETPLLYESEETTQESVNVRL
jgi:hypothetical protein